jgi:hypothetical protein
MSIGELLQWQWAGYSRYHQSRANLLIHIVAVPLFLVGTIALVYGRRSAVSCCTSRRYRLHCGGSRTTGSWSRLERVPPEPFSGPLNFIARLFLEQWVTFPRFVLSGGWSAALGEGREP